MILLTSLGFPLAPICNRCVAKQNETTGIIFPNYVRTAILITHFDDFLYIFGLQ